MEIESLLDLESNIVSNRVIFKLTFKDAHITELRMLKTTELLKSVFESFKTTEIKRVCLVFVVNKIKMPANLSLFKNFAEAFNNYSEVINEKLDFTIIQTNNGVFRMFFSLFKMYYEPIKPLYMCENDEITTKCLMSNSERKKVKNFSDMKKN